jgi:putative ABC transport system ATP-binding protein
MHCMAGLDRLTSGSVTIGDLDISNANEKQLTLLRRDRLGFIFQAFNLVPTLTAIENIHIADGSRRHEAGPEVGRERHRHRRVDPTPEAPPSELSGGQQQRVAVARHWPAVRRSSSPTSRPATSTAPPAPDPGVHAPRSSELGQTIVMVTHGAVAASYADRVIFLADGRVTDQLFDPTPDAVLDHMRRLSN